jgi:tRNA pseudouridine13 synthase
MFDFKLKFKPEDFEVSEVSLMPETLSSKVGKYSYLWLTKRNFTTFEAQEKIKSFFSLRYEDVNCEGLKDEDAITHQIVSVKKHLCESDIRAFNRKYRSKRDKLEIGRILGYGKNSVQERNLHGNCFKITLRDISKSRASKLVDVFRNSRFVTFVNYYDNQRFGMLNGPYNAHVIGKAIVDGDWQYAFSEYKRSHKIIGSQLPRNQEECRQFFSEINQKRIKFFLSAYTSLLWNEAVSETLRKTCKGKMHKFDHIGNLFIPSNFDFCHTNTLSVFGYSFYNERVKSEIFTRNLTTTTIVFSTNATRDKYHKNQRAVTISFFLPAGSYATMLVKQLFLQDVTKSRNMVLFQ